MPAPLSPEVRARLQSIVKERVLPRFNGDRDRQQTAAAHALKVHPSSINRLVNQGTGGSVSLIEKVERLLNEPPGTILGYTAGAPESPRLRDLPGFETFATEAARLAQESRIPVGKRELEFAGDYRIMPPPGRLTAGFLLQLALTLAEDSEPPKKKPVRKK
jgi:hypothetical protein